MATDGTKMDTWITQLRVPGEIERQVRAEKEATGMSLNEILVNRLKGVAPAPPLPAAEVTTSLEAAAYTFLATLDDDHQRILLDNVKESRRSLAEFMVSALKLMHDQGQSNYLMPDAAMPADVLVAPSTVAHPSGVHDKELICEECHAVIPPPYVRDGQRFCHDKDDGSTSCGRIAAIRQVREHRGAQSRALNRGKGAFDLRGAIPQRRAE